MTRPAAAAPPDAVERDSGDGRAEGPVASSLRSVGWLFMAQAFAGLLYCLLALRLRAAGTLGSELRLSGLLRG